MASSDIVQYRSPLRTVGAVLTTVFLAVYVVWTVLPIFIMFVSSLKDLLEAFKLPGVGDWSGIGVFFDFSPTFKHYHNLFADLNFTVYFGNSSSPPAARRWSRSCWGRCAPTRSRGSSSAARTTSSSGSSRPAWRRWWR